MQQPKLMNLEGLRGLAALSVVIGHLLYYPTLLSPGYNIKAYIEFSPPAHFSVLIFFCLSGYVIGHTTRERLADNKLIYNYIAKRFIRLYPIYIISIIITLPFVFALDMNSLVRLAKHLTFTGLAGADVYFENNPLWSLSYEVLFYLLFIPISYFRISRLPIIIVTLSLAIVNSVFLSTHSHPLVTSLSLGFLFWVVGLTLSDMCSRSKDLTSSQVLSLYLIAISLPGYIGVIQISKFPDLIGSVQSIPWVYRAITFSDIVLLPICGAIIMLLTNKEFRYRQGVIMTIYLLPIITNLHIYISNGDLSSLKWNNIIYFLSLVLLLDLVLFEEKIRLAFNLLVYSGSISYAIYVTHFPLLSLFSKFTIFSDTIGAYVFRLAMFFIILVMLSILLGRR